MRATGIALLAAAGAGLVALGFALGRRQRKLVEEEGAQLWSVLALRAGARVGEVGAGSGEMTQLIAARVGGSGAVFATEVNGGKFRKLERRTRKFALKNIVTSPSDAASCNLPVNSCDAIFMRGVYHHLTNPEEMNSSILRALRPGGALAVIDFAPRRLLAPWTPKGIPSNRGGHGVPKPIVVEELEKAGFEQIRSIDQWPGGKYCVLFQKPIAS